MQNYRLPLEPGKFYHIYNRGNNSEKVFYLRENYKFFLRRYDEYLTGLVETYAFCLLPNHFHFLVRVKEEGGGEGKVSPLKKVKPLGMGMGERASAAFQRLFTSYAMALNNQENRHGSLFEKPFKRIEVKSTKYLANLVFYIHANPQLHGIVPDFRDYPWSSYQRILNHAPTALEKDKVLEWFSSKDNFISYHNSKMDIATIKELMIEED